MKAFYLVLCVCAFFAVFSGVGMDVSHITSGVAEVNAQGLVPTGNNADYSPDGYGSCEFVDTVNNVIQFLIQISALLAVIVFLYAGFIMVSSRGDSALITGAKKLFANVLIGFVILLTAFLVINTIIGILVGGASGGLTWQKIDCKYAAESAPADEVDIEIGMHEGVLLSEGDGSSVTIVAGPGDVTTTLACDTSRMATTNFLGGSVTINRDFIASAQRINAAWEQRGGHSFYKVRSVGGYSCRQIRNSTKLSNHSYGLAIDINPRENPHQQTQCVTDMPSAFVKMFTDEGWGWGCNWRSSKDAMHFSKAKDEGGNMSPN